MSIGARLRAPDGTPFVLLALGETGEIRPFHIEIVLANLQHPAHPVVLVTNAAVDGRTGSARARSVRGLREAHRAGPHPSPVRTRAVSVVRASARRLGDVRFLAVAERHRLA